MRNKLVLILFIILTSMPVKSNTAYTPIEDACFLPILNFGALNWVDDYIKRFYDQCNKVQPALKCECLKKSYDGNDLKEKLALKCDDKRSKDADRLRATLNFANFDMGNYEDIYFGDNSRKSNFLRCPEKEMAENVEALTDLVGEPTTPTGGHSSMTSMMNGAATVVGRNAVFLSNIILKDDGLMEWKASFKTENCISLPEYKLMNSFPSEELISSIVDSKMTLEKFEESFFYGFFANTDDQFNLDDNIVSAQISNLVRYNPLLIRKLASVDEKGKKELIKEMYQFIKNNKGNDQEKITENYKTAMAEWTDKNTNNEQKNQLPLCSEIEKKIVALATDDCFDDASDRSPETKLLRQIESCTNERKNLHKHAENIKTKESPFGNLLLNIGNKTDYGYEKFVERACPDFNIKLQNVIAKECSQKKDEDYQKCADEFKQVGSSKRKSLLKDYAKANSQFKGILNSVSSNKFNINKAIEKNDEDKRDKDYFAYYKETFKDNIRDFFSGDVSDVKKISTESYNNYVAQRNAEHSSSEVTDYAAASDSTNQLASDGLNPQQVIPPFLDSPKTAEQPFAPADIKTVKDVENFVANSDKIKDSEVKKEIIEKSEDILAQSSESSQQIKDLEKKLKNMEDEIRLAESKNDFDAKPDESSEDKQERSPASVGSGRTIGGIDNTHAANVARFANDYQNSNTGATSANHSKAQNTKKNELGSGSVNDAMLKAQESKSGGVDVSAISLIASPVSASEIKSANGVVIDNALVSNATGFGEISSNPEKLKSFIASELKDLRGKKIVAIQCTGAGCSSKNEMYLQVERVNNQLIIRSIGQDVKVSRNSRLQDLSNIIQSVN